MNRGVGKIRTRFKKKWRGYPIGAIINPLGALRNILLKQDIVEIVQEVPAVENPKAEVQTEPSKDEEPTTRRRRKTAEPEKE